MRIKGKTANSGVLGKWLLKRSARVYVYVTMFTTHLQCSGTVGWVAGTTT